jgi:hypothetical protein
VVHNGVSLNFPGWMTSTSPNDNQTLSGSAPSSLPSDMPSAPSAEPSDAPSNITPVNIPEQGSSPSDIPKDDISKKLWKLPSDTPTHPLSLPSDAPNDTPTSEQNSDSSSPSDIPTSNQESDSCLTSADPNDNNNKLPKGWLANALEDKSETAAKDDDASVPLHFWNSALESKIKRKLSLKESDALNVIRTWSVEKIWKKSITKCFCKWLRCRKCHFKSFKGFFDSRTTREPETEDCLTCKTLGSKCEVRHWENDNGQTIYQWKSNGRFNYRKWYKRYYCIHKRERKCVQTSRESGIDCIRRSIRASTWAWDHGSRLYFWRWGNEFWEEARDGVKIWIQGDLPNFKERQQLPKEKDTFVKVQKKVNKVRERGYITKGPVESVTSFFSVPKGEADIRMVYNGTSCGLNDAVFAPWFAMPTIDSHLRAVDVGTYMADCDIGEMFLNFMLDPAIRPFAGVDLTELFADEAKARIFWERWIRMLMGFKPSPYCTTRAMRQIEPFLKGARDDPLNVFRWDKVILNLPGSIDYNPTKPWVYKVREDDVMAADLFTYCDDLRPTAPSEEECWDGAHQVCCRLTWFGIQDAPRKRRNSSQRPGAWAGSIIHTDQDCVTVLVSEAKWLKTKRWIAWMLKSLEASEMIDFKELERCRGFLIYVSRTYKPFVPYLRGIHKTIDNWRPFRDADGWKLTEAQIRLAMEEDEGFENEQANKEEPGPMVKAVPRLLSDVRALNVLTASLAPPKVVKRRKKAGTVCYGFGDASGKGFGSSVEVNGIHYSEYGTWSPEIEGKHSNYKELRNLVNAVVNCYEAGLLKDAELFLFTDNFVAECAFYNGGSNKNKDLNELVFKLWQLQMHVDFTMHVFHVSGTRMIASGIDGLSRGDKLEGVTRGEAMVKFVPIHMDPLSRSPLLRKWVESWWDDGYGPLKWMTPADWFNDSMTNGNFLWNVPPAAAQTAIEQLCTHVHGRPHSCHIVLLPRLCTSLWRKQAGKVCDLILHVQPGEEFWGEKMYEPLLIMFYFPLLPYHRRFKPWQLKGTRLVERTKCEVRRLQTAGEPVDWSCLRKLLIQARAIPTMSESVASKLLQCPQR